jgi:hypothetical protein
MNKVCTSACHVNTWLARGGNELTPAGSSHATPWEQNWHEGCFACTVCRVPFEHTFYAGPDGRPYCSLHIRPSRSITSQTSHSQSYTTLAIPYCTYVYCTSCAYTRKRGLGRVPGNGVILSPPNQPMVAPRRFGLLVIGDNEKRG